MFTEESKLLIAHWDAVEDIKRAEKRLGLELTEFLLSFEDTLKQQDWWTPEWSFHDSKETPGKQAYISHQNWRVPEEHTILIGVKDFESSRIFGTDTAPQMYVWVTGNSAKELGSALVEFLYESDEPFLGELDDKRSSDYVVKKPLCKYLPGDVDGFREEMLTESLLEFFKHYSAYEPKFTKVLQQVVGSKE